jgi:hypothetical protein
MARARTKAWLGLALILAGPSAACAATVSTAGIPVEFVDAAKCTLVNVGRQPVQVRSLELIGFFGDAFASFRGVELAPRRTLQVFARGREHGVGNDPMFCQAEVGGSARQVRLSICTGPDLGPCRAVTD